jgi:aspartate/methionine/tyrosine aminotransferase
MAGGKPIFVPLQNEHGFSLDLEALEKNITTKTKMIVLNSPCNPTGSMLTKSELEAIDDLAIKNNLWVLSDEIYEKITYDGSKHYSLASLSQDPQRVITLNGFSKAYAMTGWRIGYAVANKKLVSSMDKVQGSILACTSSFAQKGAVAALQGPQEPVKKMLREFTERRSIVLEGLRKVSGINVIPPRGTFYAFMDIRNIEKSSMAFAMFLLNNAKVVTTPGIAFGENGEGYIRLSFTPSIEELKEGMERIIQAVENR